MVVAVATFLYLLDELPNLIAVRYRDFRFVLQWLPVLDHDPWFAAVIAAAPCTFGHSASVMTSSHEDHWFV
jgi:hypothetical protein